MLEITDILEVAALYAAVNSDDWTWCPLLTVSFFQHKMQIYAGYVLASVALYLGCYEISLLADRETMEAYFSGSIISQTVGIIFILLGVWRGYDVLFAKKIEGSENTHADTDLTTSGWRRYPFLVAIGTVFANGYNNVLVLSPTFATAGAEKGLLYALTLPLFNLTFASVLILAMIKFEERTLALTRNYAGPVGSIAMILLGIKITFF